MRANQQDDPIHEQDLRSSSPLEVPAVGILNRAAYVIRVAVQAVFVSRVEDGRLVVLKVSRRQNASGIAHDVREIPGRREMAKACNAPLNRARLNAGHD